MNYFSGAVNTSSSPTTAISGNLSTLTAPPQPAVLGGSSLPGSQPGSHPSSRPSSQQSANFVSNNALQPPTAISLAPTTFSPSFQPPFRPSLPPPLNAPQTLPPSGPPILPPSGPPILPPSGPPVLPPSGPQNFPKIFAPAPPPPVSHTFPSSSAPPLPAFNPSQASSSLPPFSPATSSTIPEASWAPPVFGVAPEKDQPIIPPSFETMAASVDYQQRYRPVIPHWFYVASTKPVVWKPFSFTDSINLEEAHRQGGFGLVSTDGGRYDVEVASRVKRPVYWSSSSTCSKEDEGEEQQTLVNKVRRCSWFRKGSLEITPQPYDEESADMLEVTCLAAIFLCI